MRQLTAIGSRPLLVDFLIAGGLTLASLITVVAGAGDIGAVSGLGLLLLLLQTMPLVVRRLWPVPVFAITLAATAAHVVVSAGLPNSIRSTLGALIGLFTVAERYGRRRSIWALAVALLVLGAIIVVRTGFPAGFGGLLQTTVAAVVAWVLGIWSRDRSSHVNLAEHRAAVAESSRAEATRQAVADERARIARELHDVVTHHVSVMVIQAGAAEAALQRRPDDARGAIRAIGATGRQAMADMRTMLGVLGPERPSGSPENSLPTEPLPGLDQLGPLIESLRAAGLAVELTVVGQPQRLHPGVELSAYRIIQEALTNTLKHAGGSRARVTIQFTPAALELGIADDGGRGSTEIAADGQGRGLIGMRERVAMFGGEFTAHRTGRGFAVSATLPLTPLEAT